MSRYIAKVKRKHIFLHLYVAGRDVRRSRDQFAPSENCYVWMEDERETADSKQMHVILTNLASWDHEKIMVYSLYFRIFLYIYCDF